MSKVVSFLILGAALSVYAADHAEKKEMAPKHDEHSSKEKIQKKVSSTSKGCLSDEVVILELKERERKIEEVRSSLEKEKMELETAKKVLEEERKKLEEIRIQISKKRLENKIQDEEKVSRLVETFEKMSPKGSSKILSKVDEDLAVAAMSRISTARLAKIMNLMSPEKASSLSERMTLGKMRKPSNTEKGGEMQ